MRVGIEDEGLYFVSLIVNRIVLVLRTSVFRNSEKSACLRVDTDYSSSAKSIFQRPH
jgi:hypothetical protein